MSKTSTHYIVTLIQHGRRLGLDIDKLLQRAAILPEMIELDNRWVDNGHLAALIKGLWAESQDEAMGFVPEPVRPGSWALSCDYMLAAENLGELYRRGERIWSLLRPDTLNVQFSQVDSRATLQLNCYVGDLDPNRFMTEFWAVIWHRFACWAIDENIQLQEAEFSYSRPSHGFIYEELFQCDISFEQPSSSFTFNRKYLQKPIVRSKTDLQVYLQDSPADLLYLPGRDVSVQSHIKGELLRSLREQMRFPAFETICSTLCMSSQVVRRRLAEEGTSYQQTKDLVRCDLVKNLLEKPDLAIADIAERAGFGETAALSRAFKKWTGNTPAQYRERRRDGDA